VVGVHLGGTPRFHLIDFTGPSARSTGSSNLRSVRLVTNGELCRARQ
jgi:hypothetical protein